MADQAPGQQYLRACSLIVSNNAGVGLDLSQFRIKFSVKRSDTASPNTADIKVYNLDDQTAIQIRKEFTRVLLQAGYESNKGVVFSGNIAQVIIGRESATDTFIEIIAGDGDRAYNYAILNTSIGKGLTLATQINTAVTAMTPKGVTAGHINDLPTTQLPRGKVFFGRAVNYLQNAALTSKSSWSIQNEKINFVATKAYLPGEQVVISATTGMVGTPQQTNEGVNVKVLLNPNITPMGRVYIDTGTILQQKLNLDQIALARGNTQTINSLLPPRLNADGSYYVLVIEHCGDTRGQDWYTNMICLNIDVSTNPSNSVSVGASGG